MSNYLTDEHRNIVGTIRIMAGKEFVYDAKYFNIELGHYDSNKNKTFDSYGREQAVYLSCVAESLFCWT